MKVHFTTLGCKLNHSETERLAREFVRAGHQVVTSPQEADLCVVNSCAVTRSAARRSRRAARRPRRLNPRVVTVLTGCYAEVAPEAARRIEGIGLVVGNRDKERLLEILADRGYEAEPPAPYPLPPAPYPLTPIHTRAFVKIQDGCNMSCTFCIIPLARGRERSRPSSQIVAEIRDLVAAGHQEIVLTGVQLSAYGRDKSHGARTSLRDLVAQILDQTDVSRLRLSSLAPWTLDAELLALWRDPRLCRHLHLSLQSGSDGTLRRMRRPYTTARYARAVAMAREMIPGVAITTDIIVGFPGETEAEFEESLRFVEEMAFARLHVFRYSPRPGTEAASLPHQVPHQVKQVRSQAMIALGRQSARRFHRRHLGQQLDVLWETQRGDHWSGFTDNYIPVTTQSAADVANTITPVKLAGLTEEGMWGQIVTAQRSI
ncbi:MAG: tRNA (N(6)-L-threonylcarbamoyladenosine(37)-C(2))-methylthiotransferase MtaB [Anaerolineae bacterium]